MQQLVYRLNKELYVFNGVAHVEVIGRPNNFVELKLIKVFDEFQNQGIGSDILKNICIFCDNHKINVKLLAVQIKNELASPTEFCLIQWYKKFGFVPLEQENEFYIGTEMIRFSN